MSNRTERGIRIGELRAKLGGVGESTIFKYVALGKLPRPRMLHGTNIWLESEIDALLRSLPQTRPPLRATRSRRRAA